MNAPVQTSAGVTPGPWLTHRNGSGDIAVRTEHGVWITYVAGENLRTPEQEANARLIADAGTTYHLTGKTPSELAAEVESLRAGLSEMEAAARLLAIERAEFRREAERLAKDRDALLVAAKKYFDDYCVDEADDTFETDRFGDDTGCSREQHDDAVALRAAIHQCEGAKA